jgi:glucose/arabinose dehydrogenase
MKTQATKTGLNEVERSTMFAKGRVTIATSQDISQDFADQELKIARSTQFTTKMIMWLVYSTSTDQDQKVQE